MECEVCGKTMYWCLGHTPYRVISDRSPGGQGNQEAGKGRVPNLNINDWVLVDEPGHLLGGVRKDGSVFVNVGLEELLAIAPQWPTTAEAIINLARLAFQAGVNSVEEARS